MSLLLTRRQAVQAVGLTAFGFAFPASAADQNPFGPPELVEAATCVSRWCERRVGSSSLA
jgi:hypothetical protein